MSRTPLSVAPARICTQNQSNACKATAVAGISDKLCATCRMVIVVSLGLLLGTEAPIMTPSGVDFSFCFYFFLFSSG